MSYDLTYKESKIDFYLDGFRGFFVTARPRCYYRFLKKIFENFCIINQIKLNQILFIYFKKTIVLNFFFIDKYFNDRKQRVVVSAR